MTSDGPKIIWAGTGRLKFSGLDFGQFYQIEEIFAEHGEADWTREQVEAVAQELGVPFVDES